MAMPTPGEAEREVIWHCGFCLTHKKIGHCVRKKKEKRKRKAITAVVSISGHIMKPSNQTTSSSESKKKICIVEQTA